MGSLAASRGWFLSGGYSIVFISGGGTSFVQFAEPMLAVDRGLSELMSKSSTVLIPDSTFLTKLFDNGCVVVTDFNRATLGRERENLEGTRGRRRVSSDRPGRF